MASHGPVPPNLHELSQNVSALVRQVQVMGSNQARRYAPEPQPQRRGIANNHDMERTSSPTQGRAQNVNPSSSRRRPRRWIPLGDKLLKFNKYKGEDKPKMLYAWIRDMEYFFEGDDYEEKAMCFAALHLQDRASLW